MCDPRQGSTLTGQPRGTICRVTCTLRRYLPACQPTSLPAYQPTYQVHRRERDLPQPLAHALSHSHSSTLTHSHTHTHTHYTYHWHTGIPTPQAGRHRQDAGPGFVTSFRGGTVCSSSGTKRSAHGSLLEQAHPPPAAALPPHFGARFDPSLVSHHLSWPGARRSLARSFIAHGPDGPVARH